MTDAGTAIEFHHGYNPGLDTEEAYYSCRYCGKQVMEYAHPTAFKVLKTAEQKAGSGSDITRIFPHLPTCPMIDLYRKPSLKNPFGHGVLDLWQFRSGYYEYHFSDSGCLGLACGSPDKLVTREDAYRNWQREVVKAFLK